jgi:diguanylate cyclase (GGDEF)-like protein
MLSRWQSPHATTSLTWKLVGVLVVAIVLVVPPAMTLALGSQRRLLEIQYLERARATANLLDAMVASGAELAETGRLFDSIQRVLWLEPDVLAIEFNVPVEGALTVVASSRSGRAGLASDGRNQEVLRTRQLTQALREDGAIRTARTITPIHVSREVVGTIQVDLSLEALDDSLSRQFLLWVSCGALLTLLLTVVVLLALRRVVLLPVSRLAAAVAALGARRDDVQLEVHSSDELGALNSAFNHMAQELKAAERRAHYLAFHDPLTELPNRRLFMDRLHQAIAHCRRGGREGAVLYVDLDGFKPINDALGHAVGDVLLREVATRLRGAVRAVDTVARLGGDEFTVLLDDLPPGQRDDPQELLRIGRKLLRVVAEIDEVDGHRLRIGASAGVRVFDGSDSSTEAILRDADRSMYRAKAEGRNQVRVHEPLE